MLTRGQVQEHIDQLDSQIPKEDAELVISYEGDPAASSDCEIRVTTLDTCASASRC
jgi:hypothetical protein